MKRLVLPALAILAAVGLAQTGRFRYADTSKGVVMTSNEGRGVQSGQGWRIDLRGNVVANDKPQGLELRAQRITAEVGGTAQKSLLRHAVAEGGVRMVKTARNAAGVQTTQIDSQRADYRSSTAEATVDLGGPVTIRNVNPAKRETLVASGSRGRAVLAPGTQTDAPNALRRAELTGAVKVNVVQARNGGRFIATARRMILVQGASTRTITLLDDVDIAGEGAASVFSAEDQKKFTMVLNMAGEVVEWSGDNR